MREARQNILTYGGGGDQCHNFGNGRQISMGREGGRGIDPHPLHRCLTLFIQKGYLFCTRLNHSIGLQVKVFQSLLGNTPGSFLPYFPKINLPPVPSSNLVDRSHLTSKITSTVVSWFQSFRGRS